MKKNLIATVLAAAILAALKKEINSKNSPASAGFVFCGIILGKEGR
jgi:hypothetical protein